MLFVLAGILLLSMGVAGYGSSLGLPCDVDTRGLIGFLVTMMAVLCRDGQRGLYKSMSVRRMPL